MVRESIAAVLCAVLAICGVALISSNGGPFLAGTVRTHGYFDDVLALFAFVLGPRLRVVGFINRDQTAP